MGGSQRCLCLRITLGGFVNWQYLAHHRLINQNFGDGPAIIVCLKLLNDSNMQSGLRATASDAFFFHSSPLTVYSLSYIQWILGKNQKGTRKTKRTNVRVCGKAKLCGKCLSAQAFKSSQQTVKITVSHQASERVTFDGSTIKRFFDTVCMLPINN